MKKAEKEEKGKKQFLKWSKKKSFILAGVLLVIIFIGVKVNQGAKAVAAMVNMVMTTPVTSGDIEDNIKLKAVLEGTDSVEVVSSLHAEILALHVQEGDKVEKGQLLATLDRTTLEQTLAQEENAIALERLRLTESLKQQQIQYESAVLALEEAQVNYNQVRELYDMGAESYQSLIDADHLLREKEGVVNGFYTQGGRVVASPAEIKAIENAEEIFSANAEKLEDTEIRSQIAGTVTRVYTRVGRFADDLEDNLPLFVIENIENLQLKVMVSEYDIAKVQLSQEVEISADILNGKKVRGVVERISPTGELKDGSASERVIPVYIKVTEKDERLIAGITASAEIKVANSENTLILPYEAIAERFDGTIGVFKVNEDNSAVFVPVELGIETDLNVEVISEELEEGNIVIINPNPMLEDGTLVNPV